MSKKSKYGVADASQRIYKDTLYDSKLEMNYARHLDVLKKAVELKDRVIKVEEQVPFEININGIKICKYLLDFKVTYADNRIEYIDVKGVKTSLYILKKKLVEAIYPIKIKEVKQGQF